MPYGIAALHRLVGKNKGRFISKAIGENLCRFREEKQPELNRVDCVALSFTVPQESSKVTIGSSCQGRRNQCQSMINLAVFVSLSVLRGYATDSGLNGDIPAAHLH